MTRPAVLVIAGSDSSGGAGITQDVRTLADLGVEVLCAVTAVTAQSNRRVEGIHPVPADFVRLQIEAACRTRLPDAIKVGMLGGRAAVEAVAAALRPHPQIPLVVDPVLVASSGGALLDAEGRKALTEMLLSRASLVTPNVPEAAALLGEPLASDEATLIAQARRILSLGTRAVLLKGGHAGGGEAVDWLVSSDRPHERLTAPRLEATRRGTGCALASAIAAELARGKPLAEACRGAKQYVLARLRESASELEPPGHAPA
ncbi:MAG: bifunctional hydroxymethylpyrimidine kinase/phosphomethylpyrimidine kinase [Steroidobacteraceae bacterium]